MFSAARLLSHSLRRCYQPDYIVMPRTTGHWVDPDEVIKRITNIIKAHDRITDSSVITPDRPFSEMKLDDFDITEIFLEVEQDFFMEFSDEQVEGFKTIKDAVEVISNHRFADSY